MATKVTIAKCLRELQNIHTCANMAQVRFVFENMGEELIEAINDQVEKDAEAEWQRQHKRSK